MEARAAKDEGRLKEMEEQLQEAKGTVDLENACNCPKLFKRCDLIFH